MERLAIHGGNPVRKKLFPAYNEISKEEKQAVAKVLKSGILSQYLGCWHKLFYGGSEVRALEKEWAKYFCVKNAISVNSCTSGLYCAVGACGIGPGDEVIVSPYTMSATATSILIFNGIPVFADIEEDYFCIDPKSVEERITKRTKAIIAVDIFGQPYDVEKINAIAKKNNLFVIEDSAQAPGATYKGKFTGTLGNISVFSLNYHKHIHTGEGGVIVTNNDSLAERARLIRNHAEIVVGDKGVTDLVNMVGFNFRMTEIEAAIARCQLKKLKPLINKFITNANYLAKALEKIPGITRPPLRSGCSNVYYTLAFKYDEKTVGVSRNNFINAVKGELKPSKLREEEGILIGSGYVKPLYLEPMYQKMIAYGSQGCPFKCPWYKGKLNYKRGICPTAERMYEKELFTIGLTNPAMKKQDLDDIIQAFKKVYRLRKTIKP
jgi:dTDP-4-amino-4,6-dideoxygalactose transaminase